MPLLLWWALRDIAWMAVWRVLRNLDAGQIALVLALNAITLACFTAPWWLILRAQGHRIAPLRLLRYRVAAFGVSYLTPGPQVGGEPVQIFAVQRRHDVPTPIATSAAVLEKILEWWVNIVVLACGVIASTQLVSINAATRISALFVLVGVIVALMGYVVALWRGQSPISKLLQKTCGFDRKLGWVCAAEAEMNRACRNRPRTLALALLFTVLSWLLVLADYWVLMSLLGVRLTPVQLLVAATLNRLAFLLPLPGGLGALESSQVLAMSALGLDPAIGISHSLIVRARDVTTAALGLWWLWRDVRTWRRDDA